MKTYCINNGYKCNLDAYGKPFPFFDHEHDASTYQIRVYEFAKRVIQKYGGKNVLDIGCGYGIKLKEIILPLCKDIVGIDGKHAIDFCVKNHDFGRWFEDDIENPQLDLKETFDVIICSDVIEHLLHPDNLLNYVKRHSHQETHIVISTPARDRLPGSSSLGPPKNKVHVREWSRKEFFAYVSINGFIILRHFLVGEAKISLRKIVRKILLRESLRKIQVVFCKVKTDPI